MRKIKVAILFFVPSIACGAYRCVDEKGSTHIEETPPAACANVPIMETSRSGVVLRTLAPTAPPEPKKAPPPAETRASIDQKRHDSALLDSYTSAKEIDAARDRNLEILRGRATATELRLKQLAQREGELDRTVKGFKGPIPAQQKYATDLQAVRDEKRSVEAILDKLGKEIDQTRTQFDVDKARWAELHDKR